MKFPKNDAAALARAIKKSGAAEADLKKAVLRDVLLEDVELDEAELEGADARKAKLITASAVGSAWSGADLREAWFLNVSLNRAFLDDANVAGATFIDCSFEGAYLAGDFAGARFLACTFADADLSKAKLNGTTFKTLFASKKTKWPKSGPPAPPITSPKGWMAREDVPLLEWIKDLKKHGTLDIDAWIASSTITPPAKTATAKAKGKDSRTAK